MPFPIAVLWLLLPIAGADWLLAGSDRVRGLLGLGLDDGAPDWLLGATYMRTLGRSNARNATRH